MDGFEIEPFKLGSCLNPTYKLQANKLGFVPQPNLQTNKLGFVPQPNLQAVKKKKHNFRF
ncbi:MAG TPA: hypothetical protein DCY88_34765 [Cyanobacteria bacterium UBA11372]|nr:hypothetical protein [Cyanobacteria bacterium UBA11372]